MTSRDEWIDTQASNMLFSTCLPIAKIKQILRDAMAFADAHREGQEDGGLVDLRNTLKQRDVFVKEQRARIKVLELDLNMVLGYLHNLGPIIDKPVPEHLRP